MGQKNKKKKQNRGKKTGEKEKTTKKG